MAIEEFGFEREDINPGKHEKYKGKTGKVDRVSIVFDEGQQPCVGGKIHYKDRYFLCKSTREKKEVCCTHGYEGNEPKDRVACVLVVYEISGKKLQGYKVVPWVFGATMYKKLNVLSSEWPLDQHDINLNCTNEDFQTIEPMNCKECYWRSNEGLKKKVLEEAKQVRAGLARAIAADLSLAEIREHLGIDGAGSDDAAVDVSLGDVVGNL
jgi:hypothetical protein